MPPIVQKDSYRLLIVDDEASLRSLFSMALGMLDYESVEVDGGKSALTELESDFYDLVLLDLNMPDISGLEVLRRMRERGDLTKVVILSAFIPGPAILEAASLGVTTFVGKPVTLDLLRDTVEEALAIPREKTFPDLVRGAAGRLDFAMAASLLGSRDDLDLAQRRWLELFRGLSDGKTLEELRYLEKHFEDVVIHRA